MRKIVYITPLIITSLLASCNGSTIKKQFTVQFDANGGTSVERITVEGGDKITAPTSTKEDNVFTYKLDGWFRKDAQEPFDFNNTPINENITLHARWSEDTRKTYVVNATNTDHLTFTTIDDNPLQDVQFDAGLDFKFKIKINSNVEDYILPTMLHIYIGDATEELTKDYYTIIGDEKEAIVTIDGSKTINKLTISGDAQLTGIYTYDVSSHYGLEEITSGSGYTASDKTLIFTPTESYKLPTSDDIYIYFDKADKWVKPSDNIASKYCSYNEETGALTIKASNENIENSIEITARANDYPVLENLSWNEISDISSSGKAPYIFRLGDKKTVTVNSQPHIVRIIDFNHDELSTSTEANPQYAGITFEFFNFISDSNGYSLATIYDWEHGISSNANTYSNSNLRKAIDGGGSGELVWYEKGASTTSTTYANKSVLDMLPDELKGKLKEVKKLYATDPEQDYDWCLENYNTTLFPLSFQEMTTYVLEVHALREGSTYAFYKGEGGDTNRNRTKWQVMHEVGASGSGVTIENPKSDIAELINYAGYNNGNANLGGIYWLRSPWLRGPRFPTYAAWSIWENGNFDDRYNVYDLAYAVAPGFCI